MLEMFYKDSQWLAHTSLSPLQLATASEKLFRSFQHSAVMSVLFNIY